MSMLDVPVRTWVEIHHVLNRTHGNVIPMLLASIPVIDLLDLRSATGVAVRVAAIDVAIALAIALSRGSSTCQSIDA